MPIIINIDVQLAQKKMSVGEFAAAIDITPANVAVRLNARRYLSRTRVPAG
jgi:putative transcriptional regulator